MKTTLNKIREHKPCEDSWKKLLNHLHKTEADDEPLAIKIILDALGIDDAVWALRAVDGHDKEIRLFACDCAESVLHLFEKEFPDDNRPRKAIETARRFANRECSKDELESAKDAAWSTAWAARAAWDAAKITAWAAWSTARYAARAAVNAARYAARASVNAAEDSEKEKQVAFLMKYI